MDRNPRYVQRILVAAACLLMAGSGCSRFRALFPSGKGAEIAQGESPVEVFKLDNGLTVLLKESHANPIVTLDVWVNTGSMNEPPAINGASHFLEHMLFKGTKKRGVGRIDLEIESVGGEMNAATGKDYTHYFVTLASDYVTTGLDVLSDLMMNARLDPKEMERERRVILEEYRRKQDSPFGFIFDEIYDAAYRSGPYKQTVLGTTTSLTTLSRAQLADYYRRYYTPDNMVLVVVGDVRKDKILPQIRKYFGRYHRRKKAFEQPAVRTRRAAAASRVIEKDLGDTYTAFAFPAPSIAHPYDTVVMDVLTTILGDGRSSRLYQSLREKKRLVSTIEMYYGTPKKPGLSLIFATLDAANLDAARQAVLSEINRIRRHRVGRRELAKAKKMLTNSQYFATETTGGQSQMLGIFYTLSGGPDFADNYLKYVQRVTARDVQRIARQYLDPGKMVMVTLKPKNTAPARAGGKR